MQSNIALTLVQFDPIWEDCSRNMELLDEIIKNVPDTTDLLLLPEMFLSGFSMNVNQVAQNMNDQGIHWMLKIAASKKLFILGTLPINDTGKIYNRLVVAGPDGKISWYDKRHLFRMGEEQKFYDSGKSKLIFNVKSWKILPLICYDLRFPVWSRNVNCKYDLLIYVSNWPESRRNAYLTLLKARAIENLCFVAAVNRIGKDGNDLDYAGDSVIIDPKGNIIAELPQKSSGLINFNLNLDDLSDYRKKFPAFLDADEFKIST